ncbi:nucleoprotein TPR isoform X3 [Halyomorpha halys]|uniref:nucleoprotein TPR isoform X3 n=1 Tax=Halyomorpha halys TaxID=286706 RepID=UPI0006D5061E|nr:nucleoprotein TPR isoform X3 [Halyomorpha halys]
MEGGARALILRTLPSEEYDTIDQALREKIETILNEHIEDYITAKALFESTRGSQQDKIKESQEKLKTALQERDDYKIKSDALLKQFEETSQRLSSANLQLNKLREDVQRCQKEIEELRRERDVAVDERQVTSNTLERREAEIERLSGDVTTLTSQLRAAIQAKCEAIAEADEARAKQMEIDFKEKRFEAEVSLLRKQVSDFTSDLAKANEDMSRQRRESTTQLITLQTKVAEKEEELRIEKEHNANLKKGNRELGERIDELTNKLKEQAEKEDRIVENFQQEIRAQTKLADVYKERLQDSESRAGELSTAVRELQKLLSEASSQYGELETKLKMMEVEHKEAMEAKQETLLALKEELAHANILLEAVKQESSEAAVSRLSPMAASASKLMKSGLTLTQLYTKYAEVTQELLVERQEKNRLREYTDRIIKEIEEKAPILQKQREDYNYAITTMESLTIKVDELENELAKLARSREEAQQTAEFQVRENRRLNGCCADLSRQVCYLLRELEAARGNIIPLHDIPDNLAADAKTSAEVISKHLVTFRDIEELQLTNLKLRAALREMSAEKEEVEIERESVTVKSLRGEISRAQSKIDELNERENILQKEIEIVKSQRDVYARLYKQHVKTVGSNAEREVDMDTGPIDVDQNPISSIKSDRSTSPAKPSTPVKKQVSDSEINTVRAILEELKKEHARYREERKENEKLMAETIDKLRTELSESMGKRSELASRAEHYQEISKTLQSRVQKLNEENTALEKRCNTYLASISKHELTIHQIRNEAMDAMNNVTVAEQKINNLQQEVQMLKDSERRLLRERDSERKIKHGQELLMSNLEALKAKFECSEAESKMRLESRLEEAHLECSALRRRLQEEQDRLGRRAELAEEQAKTAKVRLEEVKSESARLQKQLDEAREEVKEREARLESMSTELTSAITKSQPILDRENRIKELEAAVREREADVAGLNEQLAVAKRTINDLSEVSQSIEKQLAEVTEQYEEYKKESETSINELKKSETELKALVSQLEMKLKTSSAAEAEMRAEREAELASLRSRCDNLSKSLEEAKTRVTEAEATASSAEAAAKEQAERVASEATHASQLIQELQTVKNELSEAKAKILTVEAEKERSVTASNLELTSYTEKQLKMEQQIKELEEKTIELNKVNDLLHDQLQELGLKVSVMDTSLSTSLDSSSAGNESLVSDSLRESDKFLEVMRHLRKEKMSALSQADTLRGDKLRLEAEVEVLRRQLEESKKLLDEERSSSDTPSITAERHAQLLSKVETLNQLTENNRVLNEERDRLMERLKTAEAEVSRLEKEVVEPAKKEASESSALAERYSTEAAALRAESQRWQERANQLIERTNKNPDEIKRLTLEKENLTRQLGTEREQAKTAKSKLEEQVTELQNEKEELKNSQEKAIESLKKELTTSKEEMIKTSEELAKLKSEMTAQSESLNDIRNKERQIRLIAKRYKQQYTDTLKVMEDERKVKVEAGPSISQETEDKIKQLTEQVTTHETEIENLKRENEAMKVNYNERDERAKQILKNARAKILHLTEDKKKLEEILSKGGEGGDLRQIIAQLEKDKEEEVAEKERLQRELEVMNQRLAIMQRQLDKQQGTKPSANTSEKGTSDPPTANIKPMSGQSTSGVKQPQAQHAATVTPWRETPFASIRPMSPQTRTVVVLPSQTTSTSNQPVLVAPQQQVVHTSSTCEGLSSSPTSSHTDYMPATSSAVHNIHPATVILGQHMEAETASEEGPSQHSVQPTQNTVSIALVLPQPTTQQQGEPGNGESASVVSASYQEQVSELSVSGSSHMSTPIVATYYRQGDAGSGETAGVVSASGQEQVSEQSVSGSGHKQAPIVATYYRQSQVEESGLSVASSGQGGVGSGSSSSQQAASSTTSTRQGGQGSSKRPAPASDEQSKHTTPAKRTRLTPAATSATTAATTEGEMLLRSDGLEVEYQVPTSSQRDQEDDILVISDEDDDMPDDGGIEDGQEFEEEVEEEGRYSLEGYGRDAQEIAGYEEGEGPDIDEGSTTDQDNNEVDIIDDSSEVPNRCESSRSNVNETVASGGEATSSLSSVSSNQSYHRRPTAVPILNRHPILLGYEDGGDDSIVPSTPTLFVPRRNDGFSEAVSSPQVPSGRFTFAQEPTPPLRPTVVAGVTLAASEGMDDTRMDLSTLEEGTGRSVPSTPSHVSPQEAGGEEIGQSSGQESGGNGSIEGGEPESDQQPPADDNPDGVSSEGEKAGGSRVSQDEEEGREAEASPARRAAGSRRSPRSNRARSRVTPIVWEPSVSMMAARGQYYPFGSVYGSGAPPMRPARGGQPGRSGGFRGGRPRRGSRPGYHPVNQPFQPNRF